MMTLREKRERETNTHTHTQACKEQAQRILPHNSFSEIAVAQMHIYCNKTQRLTFSFCCICAGEKNNLKVHIQVLLHLHRGKKNQPEAAP
jgi:hypothetical protein